MPVLQGTCACGAVTFEVTQPFTTAGYCHCTRCQRRSGTAWSLNGFVPADGLTITQGRERVSSWQPPTGSPKHFCSECGGHVFAGELEGDGQVVIRFGALLSDPGITPQWHQFVESALAWEPLPDDGLPRHPQRLPT